MGIDVSIILHDLQCINQDRGSDGSYPYIWPAMVFINITTANVIVVAPGGSSLARIILSNGMHSGDTASIPSTVGVITRRFDDALTNYQLILTIVLLEKRDLSDDEITAGFNAFPNALQSAITANLGGLISTDPTTQQNAVDTVKASVYQQVHDAIESRLTDVEKLKVKAGLMVPDTTIDNSSTSIATGVASTFQVTFGNNEQNSYIIDAELQLKPVLCEAELNAVNQDTVIVNQLEAQLRAMQKQLAQAPASEKKGIEQDIMDFKKNDLNPAKAKLTRDTAALNACRASSAVAV